MEVQGISSPIIQSGDDVFDVFIERGVEVQEGDILCIASKVVAYEQGRLVSLKDKDLNELIRNEADEVLTEGPWMLTEKEGNLICNAGIDTSNVEDGFAVLWPEDIWNWTRSFWEKVRLHYGVKDVGVVVTDSRCTPRRLGVTGFALSWCGFEGLSDERGKKDLFGNTMEVTQRNIADSIADSATLVMGESAESRPFALIHDASVVFSDRVVDSHASRISSEEDIFPL